MINTDEHKDITISDSASGDQNVETTLAFDVNAVSESRKRQRKTHQWKKCFQSEEAVRPAVCECQEQGDAKPFSTF